MQDFLKFIDELKRRFPIHVEIVYNRETTYWTVVVYQKGRADDYPGTPRHGTDAVLAYEQDLDMELCFVKAHVAVKNWLNEFNDGY